jgi:sugar phosphate isomerase/epimerase
MKQIDPFNIPTPFRLGTTSYILPDEILPNVRYLADKVQDVELVLFGVDDGLNNLPSTAILSELKRLSREHFLTYTVHLPLDLRLGTRGGEQHPSLKKGRRVIECTRTLEPLCYVLHLDGREVRGCVDPEKLEVWQAQAARSLEIMAKWAGNFSLLAVENLEGYPLTFWDPVLESVPVRRCVDIGHLWLDGHTPLPFLERALTRTSVMHIHGVAERDHHSLSLVHPDALDSVIRFLLERKYDGVLTVEVFNQDDLLSSQRALADSLTRVRKELSWDTH